MHDDKFFQRMTGWSRKAKDRVEGCRGNEAQTTQSLVAPYLNEVLGWDPHDPNQVKLEYPADLHEEYRKAGEKVDIALFRGGKPWIFIEVKAFGKDLGGVEAPRQLRRYAHGEGDLDFCIFTDGIRWKWFEKKIIGRRVELELFLDHDVRVPKKSEIRYLQALSIRNNCDGRDVRRIIAEERMQRKFEEWFAEACKSPHDEFLNLILRSCGFPCESPDREMAKSVWIRAVRAVQAGDERLGDESAGRTTEPQVAGEKFEGPAVGEVIPEPQKKSNNSGSQWIWMEGQDTEWNVSKSGRDMMAEVSARALDQGIDPIGLQESRNERHPSRRRRKEIPGHPGKWVNVNMTNEMQMKWIDKMKGRMPSLRAERMVAGELRSAKEGRQQHEVGNRKKSGPKIERWRWRTESGGPWQEEKIGSNLVLVIAKCFLDRGVEVYDLRQRKGGVNWSEVPDHPGNWIVKNTGTPERIRWIEEMQSIMPSLEVDFRPVGGDWRSVRIGYRGV